MKKFWLDSKTTVKYIVKSNIICKVHMDRIDIKHVHQKQSKNGRGRWPADHIFNIYRVKSQESLKSRSILVHIIGQ